MEYAHGQAADWRDADAYAPLLGADRSVFAWEWLRRDPLYRAAAWRAPGVEREHSRSPSNCRLDAGRWGLHAFELPDRAAPAARPVWRADVHPYVLEVKARGGAAQADAFRLDRLGDRATVITAADGREHVLISDGLCTIRLDVLDGSVRGSPVTLHYCLGGFDAVERPLLSLRRLLALRRSGNFPRLLYPAEARAARWLLLLRAHDAIAAGADQRAIAAQLLSPQSLGPRWRTEAPSLRARVQRLVRGARAMAAEYRVLLR